MHAPETHDCSRRTILSDADIFRRHPSPQDVAELRALIDKNESSLASLNEEVEACSRQLSALRAKSYTHILTIQRCKAAMSIKRLLPPELLAKIFEHASEMGWARAPIVVSQVCSTWRAAAHSHPSVWSRITVNLDTRDPVRWTTHSLQMARKAPLHVTIVHTVPTATLEQVITLLLEHSEQWESLTLDLHIAATRRVLAACTAHFTRLRSIHISLSAAGGGVEEAGDTASFANAFRDAPNLASATVVGSILPRELPLRLTSLSIEYNGNGPFGPGIETSRSITEALRSLPDLETLKLRLGEINTALLAPPDIIELPKLRTLTYEDIQIGDFQILKYLTAPSLTRLHACVQIDEEEYDSPTCLIPFLENSPNLEMLELDGVDIWPAQWHSTLLMLPNLRELHLHDSDIDDAVIEGMFRKDGLCPNLQRIDLRWCQHVRGTTLVQLVESRIKDGGCRIEEATAIGCSLVRKHDVMQLASLTTFRVVPGEWDGRCREFRLLDP